MTKMRSTRVRRRTRMMLTAASVGLLTVMTACGGDAATDDEDAAAAGNGGQIEVTEVQSIADAVPQEVAQTGKLKVASEVYPPAVIVPPQGGEPSGWEIAIAKDVATLMGLEAEISIVPFDGLIASLQANRFDVAMGEIFVSPERQELVWMVSDHESGDSFLVTKDSTIEEIGKLEDLCGLTVAVQLGSIEQQRMDEAAANCQAQGLPELSIDTYKEQAQVNLALQGGKVDLSIGSTSQLAYILEQAPNQFRMLDAPFIETLLTGVVIADTPYEADMAEAVRMAVQELIDSGRMQEILDEFNAGKGNVEEAVIHPQTGV